MAEHRTIKSEKFDAAVAAGLLEGNPYLPIFTAVRHGLISHIAVPPSQDRWKITNQNVVITIGDDFHESKGPQAFHRRSLIVGMRKCAGIVLQVADFQTDVMAAIPLMASAGVPIMIVETRERHEIEWFEFIKRYAKNASVLYITTKNQNG